jgi:hypothetical protein
MAQYRPGVSSTAAPTEENLTNFAEYNAYAESQLALALPYDPTETFSLALEMDATDALEKPEFHPVAVVSGIADRLAAIEMLMYPPGDSLLGGLLGSVAGSIGAGMGTGPELETNLQRRDAPIVLFFWGPGRIVPVRIKSLTIDEQAFSPTLYPLRAKATIGIQVLTPQDLKKVTGDKATEGTVSATVKLATGCYSFTRGQKEVLATLNLANAVESIVGMLPI